MLEKPALLFLFRSSETVIIFHNIRERQFRICSRPIFLHMLHLGFHLFKSFDNFLRELHGSLDETMSEEIYQLLISYCTVQLKMFVNFLASFVPKLQLLQTYSPLLFGVN